MQAAELIGAGQTRAGQVTPITADDATRTVEVIASTGAERATRDGQGRRYFERLDMSPEAINLSRFVGSSVLDTHRQGSLDNILGVVTDAWLERGKLYATLHIDNDEVWARIRSGTVRHVSVGYSVENAELVEAPEGGDPLVIVTRWTPCEISFVPVPADAGAHTRQQAEPAGASEPAEAPAGVADADPNDSPASPAVIDGGNGQQEEFSMTDNNPAVEETAQRSAAPAPAPQPAPTPAPQAPTGIPLADGLRLLDQARTFGSDIETQVRGLITDPNQTVQSVESAILASAARAQAAQTASVAAGSAARDSGSDRENQGQAMIDALAARMMNTAPTERGRAYRGVRIAHMMAERNGIASRDEVEILERSVGMHTTSDFANLLTGATNRVLLAAYQAAQPTYRELAARRSFQDFRPHSMLRVGEFPLLEEVQESGEIKHGTLPESKETISLKTRGKLLALTRQAIINDDLGALSDMAAAAGRAAARTENKAFFDSLLANSGGGQKLSDGKNLFHADHANLAGSGGAISETTVDAGRKAVRTQKGISGEVLNYAPRILLVGPALELAAEKFVAAVTPATQADFNPFAGKLRVVVDANITGNAWYLFTDPSELAAFVYGYLRDAEAPMVTQHEPFNQDGVVWKVLHDFAIGPVDYRAAYRNAGA